MTEKKNALTVGGITEEKLIALEEAVKKYSIANLSNAEVFKPALMLAEGMTILREQLTPDVMKRIDELQGNRLGFRTDKRPGERYPPAVVKDCFIEATLMGLRPIGNEFNIISSSPYVTREGLSRLLRDYPGLTDLEIKLDIKAMREGRAVVFFTASWLLKGSAMELSGEIPVRVNAKMGIDAVLGKADRKAKYRIYNRITGSRHSMIAEGDADDAIPADFAEKKNGLDAGRRRFGKPKPEPATNGPVQAKTDAGELRCPGCDKTMTPEDSVLFNGLWWHDDCLEADSVGEGGQKTL